VTSAHLNRNFDENNASFTDLLVATSPGHAFRQPVCHRRIYQITAGTVDQYNHLRGHTVQRHPIGDFKIEQRRSEIDTVYRGQGDRYG